MLSEEEIAKIKQIFQQFDKNNNMIEKKTITWEEFIKYWCSN